MILWLCYCGYVSDVMSVWSYASYAMIFGLCECGYASVGIHWW